MNRVFSPHLCNIVMIIKNGLQNCQHHKQECLFFCISMLTVVCFTSFIFCPFVRISVDNVIVNVLISAIQGTTRKYI